MRQVLKIEGLGNVISLKSICLAFSNEAGSSKKDYLPSFFEGRLKCLEVGREGVFGSGAGQISFSNSSDQSSGRSDVKSSLLLGRLLNSFELFETIVLLKLSGLSAFACLPLGFSKKSCRLVSGERSGDEGFLINGRSLGPVNVLLLERN